MRSRPVCSQLVQTRRRMPDSRQKHPRTPNEECSMTTATADAPRHREAGHPRPRPAPAHRPLAHAADRLPARRRAAAAARPGRHARQGRARRERRLDAAGRRRARRRGQRPVRQPRRCSSRVGVAVGYARKSDGSTGLAAAHRLPRVQGRHHRPVAVRPRRGGRGRDAGAHQLRRARRHRHGPRRRAAVPEVLPDQAARPTWRSSAAGASCRSSPPVPPSSSRSPAR